MSGHFPPHSVLPGNNRNKVRYTAVIERPSERLNEFLRGGGRECLTPVITLTAVVRPTATYAVVAMLRGRPALSVKLLCKWCSFVFRILFRITGFILGL